MKNKRIKKLLMFIGLALSSFMEVLTFSLVVTPYQVSRFEYAATYMKSGTRIDIDRKIDHTGLLRRNDFHFHSLVNSSALQGSKFYYESFTYNDESTAIKLEDSKYSKVLVSIDDNNHNYFNVELAYGDYPKKPFDVIVTEEVAASYGITPETPLPYTKTVTSIYYTNPYEYDLNITGVFKFDANNNYLVKKDKYGHDCEKNVFISSSLDLTKDKGDVKNGLKSFIGILRFNNDNATTNNYIYHQIFNFSSADVTYTGFSDFLTISENESFTYALNYCREKGNASKYVYSNLKLFCPLAVIFFALSVFLAGILLIKHEYNHSIYFTILTGVLFACLVTMICPFVMIGESTVFLISEFSSVLFIILISTLMASVVLVDIIHSSKKHQQNMDNFIKEAEEDEQYKVSVVIPNYNGSEYICQAIESVLSQTYKNIEIIVVDDGSTDESVKIVSTQYPSVKIIKKKNGGVSSALNVGIKEASGHFICWLSHDDVWNQKFIESSLCKWKDCSENDKIIISTNTKYINQNGKNIIRFAQKNGKIKNVVQFLKKNVNGCSLLLPKTAFENRLFREDMAYMQDYYLWAGLVSDGYEIEFIRNKLCYSRVHDKQVTKLKHDEMEKDFAKFAESYLDPFVSKNDFKNLKHVVFALSKKVALHPFYKKYIDKYTDFLKINKKFGILDKMIVALNNLEGTIVLKARHLFKK